MRARNGPGKRENEALDAIPLELIERCNEAAESHYWDLGLKCAVLDAYAKAQAMGARTVPLAEVLGVDTTVVTRWRRRRQELMESMEPLRVAFGPAVGR